MNLLKILDKLSDDKFFTTESSRAESFSHIAGLGKNTGKASSFLIMMILGGGVIPLIQGWICDFDLTSPEGIFGITWTHFSYVVPLLGFAYLGFYGFYCPKILKRQGINHIQSEGGGH